MVQKIDTVTLDGNVLSGIAKSSSTAGVVMKSLAKRERLRLESDISRMKTILIRKGEKIIDEDYQKFWKELEASGVGAIIYGRNGNRNRFRWHYSLKAISRAALEGKDIQALRLVETKQSPTPRQTEPKAKPDRGADNVLFIQLRRDYFVDIRLPSDITKDEAEAIHRAINRVTAS